MAVLDRPPQISQQDAIAEIARIRAAAEVLVSRIDAEDTDVNDRNREKTPAEMILARLGETVAVGRVVINGEAAAAGALQSGWSVPEVVAALSGAGRLWIDYASSDRRKHADHDAAWLLSPPPPPAKPFELLDGWRVGVADDGTIELHRPMVPAGRIRRKYRPAERLPLDADQSYQFQALVHGHVSEAEATEMVEGWRARIEARIHALTRPPTRPGAAATAGMLRMAMANLGRFGPAFVRAGWREADLLALELPHGGNGQPVAIGLMFSPSAAIARADLASWWSTERIAAEIARAGPVSPWDYAAPPWLATRVEIAGWTLAMRPGSDQIVARRPAPAQIGDDGEAAPARIEEVTIEQTDVARLAEAITARAEAA